MKSKIIWLTGLSGSGKTTLSNYISKKLVKKNFKIKKIDGDIFRKKNKNNNFTKKNIIQNNLAVIKYIKSIKKKYDFIIVSLISPLKKTRTEAFEQFGDDYLEVYTKCNIKELIRRDTKDLYNKAKKNLIKNLIGYNSSIKYENTKYKKLIVYTAKESIKISANKIIKKLNIKI